MEGIEWFEQLLLLIFLVTFEPLRFAKMGPVIVVASEFLHSKRIPIY